MNQSICPSCNHPIEITDKFCPHCGSPVSLDEQQSVSSETKSTKTFTSSGNYSGTMIKGKGFGTRKIIRNIIIAIIFIGIIALVIWIKTDPNAKEKLGNILFGFVVMAIFGAVIWRKSRKGLIKSTKQRQANLDWDDDNDGFDDDDD
jgi:hypothetical protein